MDKFEKLHDMESFTEGMFNRIFEFQQKLHPAWNPVLPFEERIKGLPLHYLIFNNPDRDPQVYGPTVAHYYPLREEMRRIARYAHAVASHALICDLHPGNGFVGSLIARAGVKVIGLRDPSAKPNQIRDFYDPACYALRAGTLQEIDFPFDIAFSSWMPAGVNLTPEIVEHEPKLIVFVHTDHINEETGQPQTGTPAAYTDLPARYRLIDHWSVTRPADMLHEIWPDLSRNIEEVRHVKVYADQPFQGIVLAEETAPLEVYDWERELEMALLALEAKAELHALGYQV